VGCGQRPEAPTILWDLDSGKEIRTFPGHPYGTYSVAFSPDGDRALSGGGDGSLTMWDLAAGVAVRSFTGHTKEVCTLAFSPDGKLALSGSGDGAVLLHRVDSGREVAKMFSFPDGEWVVTTPEGYFDASPGGAANLNVRQGTQVFGMDQFYARFYRPERVWTPLAGGERPGGETLADVLATRNAPTVRILSPEPGLVAAGDTVDLVLQITDNGGGIGDASIYLNGAQAANDTRGLAVKAGEAPFLRTGGGHRPVPEPFHRPAQRGGRRVHLRRLCGGGSAQALRSRLQVSAITHHPDRDELPHRQGAVS